MKIVGLTLAAGLLAACTTSQAQQPAAGQAAQPATGLWTASYVCGDGHRVDLRHDRAAGVLQGTRGGEVFTLQEQVGKNPPRFVSGSDSVEVLEDGLTLLRGQAARQSCALIPPAPVAGTLWGTLAKLDRMALPAGTRAKVLLVDAARQDTAAIEIASTEITTTGNQVPLAFLLRHPPERVTPRPMTYQLQARIEAADGKLLYITDTATFVLESAAPQPPVDLRLVRVGGG